MVGCLAVASLVGVGPRTVTTMLVNCGRQFRDWSGAYRLFSHRRFEPGAFFDVARRAVEEFVGEGEPLVGAIDDTLIRRGGRKTEAVAYRRDPLGPPFHTNLVLGQRVLQLSVALPFGDGRVRMVPVDFVVLPSVRKPRKNAPEGDWAAYRRHKRACSLPAMSVERLRVLRQALDGDPGGRARRLVVVGDGGFTNGRILRNLPDRTVFIGRVRSDAKLYHLPKAGREGRRGRRRIYGPPAPTPEELRTDATVPWRTARVWAAGRWHDFRYKSVAPVRWRACSGKCLFRLVVIAPLGYRPRKGSRLLYRKAAYLMCTDPDLPVEKLIQWYVWRWDIEVNFRDEKTLLGVGDAQVRTPGSVERVPALIVASYALLLVAAARAYGPAGRAGELPLPKWSRRSSCRRRATTSELIRAMRMELWGRALGVENLSHFEHQTTRWSKSPENPLHLPSAIIYAPP